MMGESTPAIQCIGVSDGRIAALGADRDTVGRQVQAGGEIHHFPGACVLPGFWDTHLHVASVGSVLGGCWLYGVRSIEEIVDRLAHLAAAHPEHEVITGQAGNLDPAALAEGRLPVATDLDRAVPDRPVVISDVNKRVGNTAALGCAGIGADTPEPEGGVIKRSADGEPTGVVWFGPGKALFSKVARRQRQADFPTHFIRALQAFAAKGITTVVDGYESPEEIETVRRLDAEGKLPCRVIAQPAATSEAQLDALLSSGLEFGQELGSMGRVGPVKLFYDQFVMHRTARMRVGYEGEPGNTGGYFLQPEAIAQRLSAVMDRGFPAGVHVTGDAGITELVDIFAAELGRRGSSAPRGSYLIHGYFPPPGVPERMAELGLGMAAQPPFLHHWADTLGRFVGRPRAEHFYPIDGVMAAGVTVAGGSDAPVADFDPLLGIHAMATRQSASGRVWGAEHALTVPQALGLYTESAAALFSWSGFPGRLAIGGPADFVVLDRDPTAVAQGAVRSIRVLATFVAGRETFRVE